MTFEEILDQAIAMLERRGRVTYRTLKRQFNLDDDALADLKAEIIKGQRLAVDEDGEVLVWTGGTTNSLTFTGEPPRAPLGYTPTHLVEKILTSRAALEGERKQVTVLFVDLKGSMELLADRDPEGRQLLDPVLERMMEAVHRYEGTENQVLGDGIMTLFGAPIAHEDHAVRTCYAALARQEAIRRYNEAVRRTHGITVQIRVGLNSGEVIVRAIGNDLHEAEALARACDDRARLVRVLARLANVFRQRDDHAGALVVGQQALALATGLGDLALQAAASFSLGQVYSSIGDYGRAAELFRRNVEAQDPGTGRPDGQIHSLAWLARALSELGQFSKGRRYGEEALRLATVEGRGTESMFAHNALGRLYLDQGDLEAAIRLLDQSLALCRAAEIWNARRGIAAALGYALALVGRLPKGRALLEEALREGFRMGAPNAQSLYIARLSAVCLLEERVDEAGQHARQALDLARQYGERGSEAHALFQLGAAHAQANPPEVLQGKARYHEALTLAEALGMRPLQAHCHHGLGSLYAKIGQREQARAELATAIDLYRAMEMTFWLPQAEATLAEVMER